MEEAVFMTCEEVAKILRVQVTSVNRYIRQGKLKAVKIGAQYRITVEEFKRFSGQDDFHLLT